MAILALPEREYLRGLLNYTPGTGLFLWNERPQSFFRETKHCKRWNARYAGKLAGCVNGEGYLVIRLRPHNFQAHRIAWLLVYGEPVPTIIDHVNGNRTDNRIANLRTASHGENLVNAGPRHHNRSGVKGVHIQDGRFLAQITHNGIRYHLGSYSTLQEAAAARRAAAIVLHGEFARHQ